MTKMILIPPCIAALFASGCSTPSASNRPAATSESPAPPKTNPTSLEGSWHGQNVTPGQQGQASLTFSGQNLEFHGVDANDWVKGTFTHKEDASPKQWIGIITDGPTPEDVGKKVCAIYKIEDGTLTISGNAPGDPNFPAAFDAPDARQFVFKHDQ
jgi:uncharacterized protein (TIGR03067 family)